MRTWSLMRLLLAGTVMGAGVTALATPAAAQVTTASIRGRVTDLAGRAVAGATVVARDVGTNQTARAVSGSDGAYSLNNLSPTSYDIVFTGPDGKTFRTRVIVSVGQSASLDGVLGAPPNADTTGAAESGRTAVSSEGGSPVVVTGRRLIELKTSEIATNVSQKQIQSLPQTDRNFLSFAALAPGVNYIDSQTNKGIQSGASTRSGVNVFIDGVSFKNQTLDGGIAGQQDSRGNPFSQLAVQEFRVLTQNYKAEYEQAGAAIVSAVTRSGTNEFHGEAFGQYIDKSFIEKDYFARHLGYQKPDFQRSQYGVSLSGPLIRDKLFFFASFERNTQDRALTVRLGDRRDAYLKQFGQYEGQFVSPFAEDLYFGKLTWTPTDRNTIDLAYSRREESDIQNFGGQTAYTQAEDREYTVETYDLNWKYRGDNFVNEAKFSLLDYIYNPRSLNPGEPSYVYQGVINFGGKNGSQNIVQNSYTWRDDLTFSGFQNHVLKGGLRVNLVDYKFSKPFFQSPEYTYINNPQFNEDFSFPSQVRLGLGNPTIKSSDTELGVYAQDDWNVTRQFQLNLGIRWDYETNMFDNDYTTSPAAAAVFQQLPQTSYFQASNYITNGNQRPPYLGMIQPRAGFSYDVFGDQHTVVFGGVGRYYDRNVFNNTLDERIRTQYQIGVFYFSKDGKPDPNGFPTLVWNPAYMNRDALLALRATARTGQPELFAVPNNGTPPRTDQFSLGVRQKVGIFEVSVSGSYIKGSNGYTTLWASRRKDGTCCDNTIPNAYGYADALIGYSGLDTRYKALYVSIDKPYTAASHWGLDIAYTFAKGIQDGNDLFSLDAPTPRQYGFRPTPFDQRHKIVLSGIYDLPFGFQISTLSTFGSGTAFTLYDDSRGTASGQQVIRSIYPPQNCAGVFAYCEVNISLEKDFHFYRKTTFGVAVDFFNVFNNDNFTGYPNFLNPGQSYVFDNSLTKVSNDTTLYAQPTDTMTLPRRLQVRGFFRF